MSSLPIRPRSALVLALALLGCPSDDVPSGDSSTGPGPGSSGSESTAAASGTGTIPPGTSSGSSSGDAVDSSTSVAASSGTTEALDGSSSGGGPSGCNGAQCCGNGIINGTEDCDCGGMPCSPEGLGFAMCEGLVNLDYPDRVYTGGILDCSPASCQYVFTTCTFCGDGNVNGNEACELDTPPDDTCESLGLGEQTEPLPCDETCQLDTSSCA